MSAVSFAEVGPLLRDGRYKEAALHLRGLARAGAPRWETHVWLGRIEEDLGRLGGAERAFRAAADAAPGAPQPLVELARLLQKAGRLEEALEVLRPAAAAACAELSRLSRGPGEGLRAAAAGLYELMEFNLYRRVFVAEARRDPAVLRAVARALPRAGARTLLAELLVAQGRLEAAQQALAACFAPGASGTETSRVEVLFELVDRGAYGRRLERAVLSCLSRSGAGDKLVLEWPRIFAALMGAARYACAFRLAEAVLDKKGAFGSPQHLMWPWFRKTARAVAEEDFIRSELGRLRAAARAGLYPHWFAYYRATLWSALGIHNAEALAELPRLRALDAKRYSWMLQAFVLVQLRTLDFRGARQTCLRILKAAPSHWWVRCRLAEAYLGLRQPARALREFETAARAPDPLVKREVLTWHGEVLLWLGEYAAGLSKLDEAVGMGARTFVHGWRGAARFLCGDARGALEDLDFAVGRDPKDFEALAWRGEALRALGRAAEARRDLDAVIAGAPDLFWARVNRGLLDAGTLEADFAALPPQIAAFLRREARLPAQGPLEAEQMRRALRLALERAKGNRRWELCEQALWRPVK